MFNPNETLTIIERMVKKLEPNQSDNLSLVISDEESKLLNNLIQIYNSSNDLKITLILKLFSLH